MSYAVTTIGDLPVGWQPVNDPSSGLVAGPPRALAQAESFSAPMVAAVAIGGVLVGALTLYALKRWM